MQITSGAPLLNMAVRHRDYVGIGRYSLKGRGKGIVSEHMPDGRTLVTFDSGEQHRCAARHGSTAYRRLPPLACCCRPASTPLSEPK